MIAVEWSGDSNADGYQIQYAEGDKGDMSAAKRKVSPTIQKPPAKLTDLKTATLIQSECALILRMATVYTTAHGAIFRP